ncbi:MAG: hypothetical protein E7235_03630 [Lachnospiraceae bacterium]|nr:hypothetical protein [Lachnospiraceae bacterium]
MKKFFTLTLVFIIAVSSAACSGPAIEDTAATDEKVISSEFPDKNTEKENIYEGTNEDGIGSVVPLSESEKDYLLSQTTNTWLEMSEEEKSDFVVLIGRWFEDQNNYIVEDYDTMVEMLDRQMEQYFKNGVDEGVLSTACDIYDLGLYIDTGSRPSGVWDDGIGEEISGINGDGIGEVKPLTEEGKAYMMEQTTNGWLNMSKEVKDDLVILIGRHWEYNFGYIVEDYEDMIVMLDRQMEQYFKNGVDENVYSTACDIFGLDPSI